MASYVDFRLLAAGLGGAPRTDRRSPAPVREDDPLRSADFAYVSGRRSISGKVGINCATGQIYTGAMAAEPGEPKSTVYRGRRVPVDAKDLLVCVYR